MRIDRKLEVLGIATLCAAVCAVANAQEPAASAEQAANGQLEEIIVTARKRQESAQDVPLSMVAVTGADIEQQSVKTIADLKVPNLVLQQAVDDSQALTFAIRGQRQSDVTLASDPSVGLNVDGLYIPRTSGMSGALLDIDRIEVLRGPQGTLYGRNTTGGTVNIITKDPTNQAGAAVDLTGGNYGAWNVVGTANLPISDSLSARFVFQRGKHDGYGHSLAQNDLLSDDSDYYRGKLRATFGPAVEAILSAYYQSNRSGGELLKIVGLSQGNPAGGTATVETAAEQGLSNAQAASLLQSYVDAGANNFYANFDARRTYSLFHRWSTGLTVKADLPLGFEFRSITGYQLLRTEGAFSAPVPAELFDVTLHKDDRYASQEFQLLGAMPTFNWVVGFYGGRESGEDFNSTVAAPALAGPAPQVSDAGVYGRSLGLFTQEIWEFVPTWRLTAGARYSNDLRKSDMNVYIPMPPQAPTCLIPAPGVESTLTGAAQCPREFSSTFRQPSWLVSVDHRLHDDVLAYVKVARGYRSGGQNIGGAVEVEQFASFAPETVLEYELGVRSETFNHTLRLNLAVFHDDYNNVQKNTSFNTADGQVSSAVTNAAQAKVDGFELETTLRVNSQFTLAASTALTDARYSKFVDFTGDRTGEPFAIPKWMAALNAHYVQPIAVGALTAQIDYNWQGKTVLATPSYDLSQITQGAYGLLDAHIGLELSAQHIEIAFFGRNLAAKKYYENATGSGLGINMMLAGPPRIYGIEFKKDVGGI